MNENFENIKPGDKVYKANSGKKFKSGNNINTVKDIINHPTLNIPAFTFEEDDSYVECRRCFKVESNLKELSTENYDLKPYKIKRVYLFYYGIFYDETLIVYSGWTRIKTMCDLMNGAFLNGVCHCLSVNQQ